MEENIELALNHLVEIEDKLTAYITNNNAEKISVAGFIEYTEEYIEAVHEYTDILSAELEACYDEAWDYEKGLEERLVK